MYRLKAYLKGSSKQLFLLLAAGLLAGFCNGLLGAGGGIVLVIFLSRMLPKSGEGARSVYSNALIVMSVLSCITLFRYFKSGDIGASLRLTDKVDVFIGAAVGGAVGGILLGKLRGKRLRFIFAIATLISGILMITR